MPKNKNIKNEPPRVISIEKIRSNKESLKNMDKLLKFNEEFSPLSGSELEYNPKIWNDNPNIKSTHNCYTYALGKIRSGLDSKAQPGYASGFNHIDDYKDYNCKSFRKRLKKDSPGSYLEKFDNACLPGFYKIFLALDPQNDYHWYRQDSDSYWSHKPGASDVINTDASGEKINNPYKSNRNFKHRNYYKPCFFACIYSDLSRSINEIYR